MGIKVAKFGGSSVADGIQLTKTKEIIREDPDRKYIVVSAPGKRYEGDNKITDILYLCKTHIEHNLPYDQLFQVVVDRYMAVEINLGVKVDLLKYFEEIRENLRKNPSADYIASRGEYLNAVLVAAFLEYDFVDTANLIKFDEKGRLLTEETDKALAEELAKHERAVLPGFYGSTPDGEIKTFSRGGSDITGALVARAVHADVYENWTDVSGVLMADPRIVDDPKVIDTITYNELRELSYMGATVLHEDAIFPVRLMGIPINIRNTNKPEDPGTMIVATAEGAGKNVITGIAGKPGFSSITIEKDMMNSEVGFTRKVLSVLESEGISFEHMPSGIDTLSIILATPVLEGKKERILRAVCDAVSPDSVFVEDSIALIAVVGRGMRSTKGTAARTLDAVAGAGINLVMIDQGSSELNIILGVKEAELQKTIAAIYNEFGNRK